MEDPIPCVSSAPTKTTFTSHTHVPNQTRLAVVHGSVPATSREIEDGECEEEFL